MENSMYSCNNIRWAYDETCNLIRSKTTSYDDKKVKSFATYSCPISANLIVSPPAPVHVLKPLPHQYFANDLGLLVITVNGDADGPFPNIHKAPKATA